MRFGFGANIAFETATRHDKVWYPLVKLKEASVGLIGWEAILG
jgi:hypothetical protein